MISRAPFRGSRRSFRRIRRDGLSSGRLAPAVLRIIGAVINANPNAGTSSSAFNGGHTLHKLTLTNDAATMPHIPADLLVERLRAGCDEVLARSAIRQVSRMAEPGKEKATGHGTSKKLTLKHGGDSTMQTSRKFFNALLAAAALVIMSASAFGADPGDPFPAASEVSDQKAGSVLVYNVYTSSTANPAAQNTTMAITNTSSSSAAFVHLFFVANNCSVADRFICLTAQQTASIDAFSEDPGITGFLIAVAADGVYWLPDEL